MSAPTLSPTVATSRTELKRKYRDMVEPMRDETANDHGNGVNGHAGANAEIPLNFSQMGEDDDADEDTISLYEDALDELEDEPSASGNPLSSSPPGP